MTILHKDGRAVTNWSNVNRLVCNGRYLVAYMIDGSSHNIGVYQTEAEAKSVFDGLCLQLERKYG